MQFSSWKSCKSRANSTDSPWGDLSLLLSSKSLSNAFIGACADGRIRTDRITLRTRLLGNRSLRASLCTSKVALCPSFRCSDPRCQARLCRLPASNNDVAETQMSLRYDPSRNPHSSQCCRSRSKSRWISGLWSPISSLTRLLCGFCASDFGSLSGPFSIPCDHGIPGRSCV